MFDLKDLDRWVPVTKTALKFTNPEPRKIRLEVLAESEAVLVVTQARKDHFIGRFDGYDVVQFSASGPFELRAESGKVKVWTSEFDAAAVEIPEAVSFTRTHTRRQRNPELELMMKKVSDNMERRISQVVRDTSLAIAAERREREQERAAAEAAARTAREESTIVREDPDRGASDESAEAVKPAAKAAPKKAADKVS